MIMGRYDNFSNKVYIKRARRKYNRLMSKRKPDLFKLDKARKELAEEELFESCQVFGRKNFDPITSVPTARIMFSDDNKVMWFIDRIIEYKRIQSYAFIENRTTVAETKRSGSVIGRAIVGGMIAGEVGAIVGAMSAESETQTVFREKTDCFFLYIMLTNGESFRLRIMGSGIFDNKLHRAWAGVDAKLKSIIEENRAKN